MAAFRPAEVDELLARTGRRCCICGRLHSIQVHHIVPSEEGGSDEIDNAIPLCPNCHAAVHHGISSGSATRGYTVRELKHHRARAILGNQEASNDDRMEELIKILEFRAEVIERDLQKHYETEVKECLAKFLSLHSQHVAALRQRQYVLAHEILQKINNLSYSLETSEAGLHRRLGADYAMLGMEAYSKGALMCGYVAGDLRRKSKHYPGLKVLYWADPELPLAGCPPILGVPEDVAKRYFLLFFSPAILGPFPF
jgi:hypothetical protein